VQRSANFGVDFYAFADLQTGLGSSSRAFASAMAAGGVPYHFESIRFICPAAKTTDHGLAVDPRRFLVTFEHANADMTLALQRDKGAELETAGYRIAIWYWELAAFRPDWVRCADYYDELWVASAFGRRALQAMVRTPVDVVPPPITVEPGDGARARRNWGIPDSAFVFLYVFDYSSYVDRKNPRCLIDAYLREFGDDPRFRLVLKVSYGSASDAGFGRLVELCSPHETIVVINRILPQQELDDIYAMADCYVSPHRSEGFGLTVAEQMLRGCPVIATDYGATTDFVNEDVAYPLSYSLLEIEEDQGPYPTGYVWADPSVDHLRELMRRVVDRPEEAAAKVAAASQAVRDRYDPTVRGADLRARFVDAHATAVGRRAG
jgi:glycosyltransferase involved in cell wall biosynthesis